jgi:hypothetical protein
VPHPSSTLIPLFLAACRAPPSPSSDPSASTLSPSSASSTLSAVSPSSASAPPPFAPDFLPPPSPSSAPPLSPRGRLELQHSLDDHSSTVALALPDHSLALPARAPASRVHIEDSTFLLVAGEPRAPLDAAAAVASDTITALFHGPLAHRPERAFIVWLFATPERYAPFLTTRAPPADPHDLGYFDPFAGEIFICTGPAGVATLAHEVTHALVMADFPRAPHWLSEGIASLFELPDFQPPGEIHGKAHFRLQTLRTRLSASSSSSSSPASSSSAPSSSPSLAALAATAPEVRLDSLFALKAVAFYGPNAYIAYAMAREAMRWLDARQKLWSFYHAWREGILDDPTGEKAFASVMGETPAAATAAWVTWIRSPEAERP